MKTSKKKEILSFTSKNIHIGIRIWLIEFMSKKTKGQSLNCEYK